ncbi:MAG: hypothetical protein HY394_04430 [Candidatus Diapherotrites archaeon]|nr:hypothetical protein [Candidatus Diapherotrites archaeon]
MSLGVKQTPRYRGFVRKGTYSYWVVGVKDNRVYRSNPVSFTLSAPAGKKLVELLFFLVGNGRFLLA